MAHPLLDGNTGEIHLLLGNEAIVRGAIEAGIQAVTCYPGTPSSEVPDTFFRLSPEGGYHFEYSSNEKVALEVGAGLSLAGALTLVTMKHVGVNVAADPLMTMAYVGTPGGLVLLSADDPGCHSSQNEQDNRYYARLGYVPCMEPATAQEAKDMARDALIISRQLQRPFLLRTTTRVNHLRGPVEFDPVRPLDKPAGFTKDPARFVPIPAFARPMRQRLLAAMDELREMAEHSKYNTISGAGSVGVVASGIARAYLHDALADTGLEGSVKVLDLGFTHPLPEKLVLEFLDGVDTLLVLEELEPILENEIRALAQREGLDVTILGKAGTALPRAGEFDVGTVADALRLAAGQDPVERTHCEAPEGLPMRPPNLCAGCPHRASFFAARQVFGDDAVYSSDIGCYTLGILPPLQAADFLICMGSSISAGCGAAKAAGQTVVAFIGDSTFFHTGVNGLVNAVYNRHDVLVVILDNKTTAMTGHQPHPGVEHSVLGPNESRVDIEAVVKGCGVDRVVKVNPLNLKKTRAALEEMKAEKGVRVLIAEEPCPLFARRAHGKKPVQAAYVTESWTQDDPVLESLACPAFYKEDGRMAINELQCGGCMLCLQVSKNIKARKRGQ